MVASHERRSLMSKYLLLKHYRGGPAPVVDIDPMDRWTPAEVEAHITFMRDFADRFKDTGEYVEDQALLARGRSCATAARDARQSRTARSPRPRT